MSTRTNIDFFKFIYFNSYIKGMEYCNEILKKYINIPYYTYKNNKYKNICSQLYDRNILLLKSNIKFIDLINTVNIAYSKPVISNKQHYRDMHQYKIKIHGMIQKLPLKELKNRFNDPYNEVEERMFFRFELYKHGWNIYQIERYIYKYLLKEPFLEDYISDKYIRMFNDLILLTNTKQNKYYNSIGRPCLPISLKEHINNKNKKIIKNNMNKKYEEVKLYNELKKNLLSINEKDIIVKLLSSIEGQETLINKIENLVI